MEATRRAYAESKWVIRKQMLGRLGGEIDQELMQLEEETREWMLYLMATLPVSDLANYPLSAWTPYITHALKLRREMPWCRDLEEGIFVDYVFYPRINTEDIEECRQLFFSELFPRIEGKTMEQAVIETNYWCQEHVTYQMADDRTKSAMTAYRSCGGRCGEESTFTVTALRSIGIPSRQVYAPWWSHCDDNHAWVEVYLEGKWHFLGACEAAPKLDTGWFTNASSRAMLVHARTFTGADTDEELKVLYGDRAERFHVENGVTYEHVTDTYALLELLEVTVLHEDGTPADGALVRLEVLNMAEMMPIASMTAGKDGKVRTFLGLGNVRIHAVEETINGTLMEEENVQLVKGEPACVTITLKKEEMVQEKNDQWEAFDFMAPLDQPINPGLMTDEEKAEKNAKMLEATRMREERKASFYVKEEAEQYDRMMQARLKEARGNFDELMTFLKRGTLKDQSMREEMLTSLTVKDMTDLKADVLEEHLAFAAEYKADYRPEIFVPYVLCPRVFNETLTCYREYILNYFEEAKQKSFRKDPARIMEWIEEHLITVPAMEYKDLFYTPVASLKSRLTTPISSRILYVAICRSLGIPARLNPNSGECEYWKGKGFICAEKQVKKNVKLSLNSEDPKIWIDRQTFTLSRLEKGMYQRIDMPVMEEDGSFDLMIEPGEYRLITSNRLPNGHMYAYSYYFEAQTGKFGKGEVKIDLTMRGTNLTEILSRNAIVDFPLKDREGGRIMAGSLLEKKSNILVWIEEGKEPTEHILNEMLAQKEDFRNFRGDIWFILKNDEAKTQVTLAKALEAFPNVRIVYDDFSDNVQTLGRRMYVDPDKLPLVIYMYDGLSGVYASSGYNVGLGDLLLKIEKAFES